MIGHLLREKINEIMGLYEEHKDYYLSNEMATRDHLINPILNILGWHTSSPKFVRPNQKNELGDIPDYTLWKNERKILVIEAKKASVEVKDVKVIAQLTKYSYNMGIQFGIISNGLKWLLFNTFQQNPSERIVWVVDFENSKDNFQTESRMLTAISYSNIETLGGSIERVKLLESFWVSNLSTESDLVRFVSLAIKEKTKKELSIDLNEIEDFVKGKLVIPRLASEITKPLLGAEVVDKNEEDSEIESYKKRAIKKNIKVTFTDGTVIYNKQASDTLAQTIQKIGGENVKKLNLSQNGIPLVGMSKDETYRQYKINGGYYVIVHSSTKDKLKHLNIINERLNLNLKIETE